MAYLFVLSCFWFVQGFYTVTNLQLEPFLDYRKYWSGPERMLDGRYREGDSTEWGWNAGHWGWVTWRGVRNPKWTALWLTKANRPPRGHQPPYPTKLDPTTSYLLLVPSTAAIFITYLQILIWFWMMLWNWHRILYRTNPFQSHWRWEYGACFRMNIWIPKCHFSNLPILWFYCIFVFFSG